MGKLNSANTKRALVASPRNIINNLLLYKVARILPSTEKGKIACRVSQLIPSTLKRYRVEPAADSLSIGASGELSHNP